MRVEPKISGTAAPAVRFQVAAPGPRKRRVSQCRHGRAGQVPHNNRTGGAPGVLVVDRAIDSRATVKARAVRNARVPGSSARSLEYARSTRATGSAGVVTVSETPSPSQKTTPAHFLGGE